MHSGVIERRGLPFRYVPVELPPGRLRDFMRVVREGNFLGGNVTIPYKEKAAALADGRSEAVEICGAANVLRVAGGRLLAENSDGPGFLDAAAAAGWGRRFRRAVILGAGGSARGIACALCLSGTREMEILNRTTARAREIAGLLAPRFPETSFASGPLTPREMARAFRGAALIVQCTSLGLKGEWPDFPLSAVEKSSRFADIVYGPGGTRLVRRLRRMGVPAIDGLPMLAHQAARSFKAWTGIEPPAGEFLSFARRELARRARVLS